MKKTHRKMVCSLTILSMLAALSSCNSEPNNNQALSNAAATGEKEIIEYWYPWGGDSEKYDLACLAEFEAENPQYDVKETYVPSDGGLDNGKLLAAIAGGTPPDVIVTASCASAYALAMQNAFEPVDEFLSKAGISPDDVGDTFKDIMQYKGVSYLVPRDVNLSSLFINADIFEENGLDPNAPPKTLDDLNKMAEQLTVADGNNYSRLGFIPWIDGGDDALVWPFMFGATVFDVNTGKVNLTDKKTIDALEWQLTYAEKYDPEKINSFASGFGEAFSSDHPFMTGKVAMTVQGNWFTNAIAIHAPDLNYVIAPIPAPEGGRYGGSPLGTNVYGIPKGAKNPQGAAYFITYNLQYEIMDPLYAEWRSISPFPADYENLSAVKNGDKMFEMYLEIGTNPNSAHQGLTIVSNELSTSMKEIRDDVIYNKIDPAGELAKVETSLQGQVDKSAE